MRSTRWRIVALVVLTLAALSPLLAYRVATVANELWARLYPLRLQRGDLVVETDSGMYEYHNAIPGRAPIASDLTDHVSRVAALMKRMPAFDQVVMPQGIRWYRYRPGWFLDTAMETTSGQIWVTYWPKGAASHPPEYLGTLYNGMLKNFALPRQPYYDLKLKYYTGPVAYVYGTQAETGELLHWAVSSRGLVENPSGVPQSAQGSDKPSVCRQGDPRQRVALYGLLPDGQSRPILTWRAWQAATFGMWRYSADYPLECAGRFGGYFLVWYQAAGQGAMYWVRNGSVVPFTAARPYLVTDTSLIVYDGDEIIEAHAR